MDAKKREIRNLECELSFREANEEEAEKGNLGTIYGRAIVFNAESRILDEKGQTFREVIAPEAASMDFLNTQDIKINMLHIRELTFGRCKRGVSGNARLSVDDMGVMVALDVPNCDLGIRARELIKAGVYDGMSFEFIPGTFDVLDRESNVPLVRHTSFKYIGAITLGMDPAYTQTSLSVREMLEPSQEERDMEQREREESEAEAKRKAEEEEAQKAEREAQIATQKRLRMRHRLPDNIESIF